MSIEKTSNLGKESNKMLKKKFNDVKKRIKESGIISTEKEDLMIQVYKYKKVGFSFSAIAPVMKISEKNAERYYNEYLEKGKNLLKRQIVDNDLSDISEILLELEYLKELAYSNHMASEEGEMASIASLKIISEIIKEIADIKLSAFARRDDIG